MPARRARKQALEERVVAAYDALEQQRAAR